MITFRWMNDAIPRPFRIRQVFDYAFNNPSIGGGHVHERQCNDEKCRNTKKEIFHRAQIGDARILMKMQQELQTKRADAETNPIFQLDNMSNW
jgi:hypothetical protein